jgi:hypothetical protein
MFCNGLRLPRALLKANMQPSVAIAAMKNLLKKGESAVAVYRRIYPCKGASHREIECLRCLRYWDCNANSKCLNELLDSQQKTINLKRTCATNRVIVSREATYEYVRVQPQSQMNTWYLYFVQQCIHASARHSADGQKHDCRHHFR